jgi:periplasmic copper chaperone A
MRITRLAVVLSGTAASVLLLASPAYAHVTAHSTDATSGGQDAQITFRVPNEQGVASTTKVEIHLPTDKPFAGVQPASKAGWNVVASSVKLATPIVTDDGKITDAVSTIVWTATAGGTKPGLYDDFDIAVGLLPKTDSVTFKVLQTYSDGTVARWIEVSAPGSTQAPEHPAPVLALPASADTGTSPTQTSASSAAPTGTAGAVSASKTTKASDDTSTMTLAGVSLGVGILALLLALTALLRRRTSKP